ncbi:MAG TPA: PLP-dependent aminotransferase family protein [Rhodocyclaceae bacterium]|nr:PLP-dependent aminotransferase family protein [Rhodocyclaceae bacterium]
MDDHRIGATVIHLDRESDISLIDQMVSQLAGLVQAGQLPPGTRLPSIRKLATTVEVSTATVVGAYDRLTARGLIESRAASGYFVALRPSPVARPAVSLPPRSEREAVGLLRRMFARNPGLKAVGSGFLPEAWLEDMVSARLLARMARKGKRFYANPPEPAGYAPLRSQIALRLGQVGIPASEDHILTTFGATHAFDLICRGLLNAGDTVAVEEPGYFGLYAQLRAHGIKLVGVPRLANGPDVEVLDRVCATYRPKMFFTQTLLHNPTGGSTDAATIFRLLDLARQHQLTIVEDDVYGDLHPAQNPLRLAQVDRLERVIFIGSFSKVMSPNIRVGYLAAAPELIQHFLDQKLLSVLTTSELDERLVYELLADGSYRKHLERLRPKLSHQRAAAVKGLAQAGLRPTLQTDGGMFIWAELPEGTDLGALLEDATANGFLLTPGDPFFLCQPAIPMLRFSAAATNDEKLFAYFRDRLPLLLAGQSSSKVPQLAS